MDSIEALIAIAHRRLRLRRMLVAIERNPQLLEEEQMALKIKKPIELVGLKSRMIRAESQEKAIGGLGKRYDDVQDRIDECIGAHAEHAGELEHYESDLRRKIEGMVGSNGDPNDGKDGQTGQKSGDRQIVSAAEVGNLGQIISSETGKQ